MSEEEKKRKKNIYIKASLTFKITSRHFRKFFSAKAGKYANLSEEALCRECHLGRLGSIT